MKNKEIKQVRIGDLKTIGDLGREMRRVYRSCHKGDIPVDNMSRFITALNIITAATREADLENRMALLEKAVNDIGHPQ